MQCVLAEVVLRVLGICSHERIRMRWRNPDDCHPVREGRSSGREYLYCYFFVVFEIAGEDYNTKEGRVPNRCITFGILDTSGVSVRYNMAIYVLHE